MEESEPLYDQATDSLKGLTELDKAYKFGTTSPPLVVA